MKAMRKINVTWAKKKKETKNNFFFYCSNISKYYCFYYIMDQINVTLVKIDFFQKYKKHF